MEAFFEFSKEVLKGIVRHECISIPETFLDKEKTTRRRQKQGDFHK